MTICPYLGLGSYHSYQSSSNVFLDTSSTEVSGSSSCQSTLGLQIVNTVRWIAIKLVTDIHATQGMNFNDCDVHLTVSSSASSRPNHHIFIEISQYLLDALPQYFQTMNPNNLVIPCNSFSNLLTFPLEPSSNLSHIIAIFRYTVTMATKDTK